MYSQNVLIIERIHTHLRVLIQNLQQKLRYHRLIRALQIPNIRDGESSRKMSQIFLKILGIVLCRLGRETINTQLEYSNFK